MVSFIDWLERRVAGAWAWAGAELSPYPGRLDAMWRLLISATLVIICSMALQIPFLSVSLIVIFFTAQENTVLTRLSGLFLAIGSIVAIILSILLFKLTLDAPLLRILCAALIAFAGMYFFRVSKLGAIGYMVALVVMYAQSLADSYDNPELLTRAMLWVGVASVYPVVLTVAIQFLFRPAHPVDMLLDEYKRQLDEVERQLTCRIAGTTGPVIGNRQVELGMLTLRRHLNFAFMSNAAYANDKARHQLHVATVDSLYAAAVHLSSRPQQAVTAEERERMAMLVTACKALCASLQGDGLFSYQAAPDLAGAPAGHYGDILHEMDRALHTASCAAGSGTAASSPAAAPAQPRANNHLTFAKFAFKTVLAAMLSYVFYTGVQWPGIHTAMLTCFILALPSLGATTHRGMTRLLGCCIGSLFTLVATVFFIPHAETIVGLLAISLPIIAAGAWVAAGSARSNYIGVQMMFAFALAQLGSFGPATELTAIRDRVVGILIGLTISLTVYSLLWPEREGAALKDAYVRLLRAMAAWARKDAHNGAQAASPARVQAWALFGQNRELHARVAFEPGGAEEFAMPVPEADAMLRDTEEIMVAQDSLQLLLAHAERTPAAAPLQEFLDATAEQLDRIAARLFPDQAPDSKPPAAKARDSSERLPAGAIPAAQIIQARIANLSVQVERISANQSRNT